MNHIKNIEYFEIPFKYLQFYVKPYSQYHIAYELCVKVYKQQYFLIKQNVTKNLEASINKRALQNIHSFLNNRLWITY